MGPTKVKNGYKCLFSSEHLLKGSLSTVDLIGTKVFAISKGAYIK
jgi:hypothetical protein